MDETIVSRWGWIHGAVHPFSFPCPDKGFICSDISAVVRSSEVLVMQRKNKLFSEEKIHANFERHPAAWGFSSISCALWGVYVPGIHSAETELWWDALIARHILSAGQRLCSFLMPLLLPIAFHLEVIRSYKGPAAPPLSAAEVTSPDILGILGCILLSPSKLCRWTPLLPVLILHRYKLYEY